MAVFVLPLCLHLDDGFLGKPGQGLVAQLIDLLLRYDRQWLPDGLPGHPSEDRLRRRIPGPDNQVGPNLDDGQWADVDQGLQHLMRAGQKFLAGAQQPLLPLQLGNIGPGADDAALAGAALADQEPLAVAAVLLERFAGIEVSFQPLRHPFVDAADRTWMMA